MEFTEGKGNFSVLSVGLGSYGMKNREKALLILYNLFKVLWFLAGDFLPDEQYGFCVDNISLNSSKYGYGLLRKSFFWSLWENLVFYGHKNAL